ncbi:MULTISPECIES: hypothetical protein [Aliivibrio]|uniref:Uncharacterized protein n=2 Tax=Aliivibrio TaxID=511678 RepID=A0A4Q5KMX1_9GAMM|nr:MULTISPECIES: hypothetical protein [Aliivibrio]CED57359.1 putative uncharacterized protein [Aliivibrio wodanis]MDD9180719.1 hypothetical protein [Aliivibrio sp. A6]RYU46810.1 hypothetical protein ERW57_18945 [Aliivibrio finisterrensis]RYU47488.1 hypothetical protein ERW56_19170 [Aliivibrio finisterrensis]RYU52231.1 hypothetical protein ERW50_19265 [Aliivibrio finisterrensis]
MKFKDRLFDGLKLSIGRHWSYQKLINNVKPEYLFTVSIADEVTKGFYQQSGLDLIIELEKPTKEISFEIRSNKTNLKQMFKQKREVLKRKNKIGGKADIFITNDLNKDSFLIELKGFDPSAAEFKKDIKRFKDTFKLYNGNTTIRECALVFPTKTDQSDWVIKNLVKCALPRNLLIDFECRLIKTGEDPEDGMPAFYGNVIIIKRYTPPNLIVSCLSYI